MNPSSSFDLLSAAVLHDVKNRLAQLQLRLARHDDLLAEQALVADCGQQLTALLLGQREQAGQLQASIDAGNPADLVTDLAHEFAAIFPALQVRAELTHAPVVAFYDTFLLRLALANALHNACRHARHVVRISVRIADAGPATGGVVFEITDDGPGFDAAQLSGAEPAPLPAGSDGTGLGLFLADRIARLHRLEQRSGHIECHNHDGAVFRLYLP